MGACSTWGQRHYRTFDGRHIDFIGKCSYTLAQDCIPGSDQFSLHVQNDKTCGSAGMDCERALLLYIGEKTYKVRWLVHLISSHGAIRVNGAKVSAPYKDTNVEVSKVHSYTIIRSQGDELGIKFDGASSIQVAVSHKYRNNTCGLCGNNNGIPDDDLLMAVTNKPATSVAEFAESWAMPEPNEKCESPLEVTRDVCSNASSVIRDAAKRICMVLLSENFSACHTKVDPVPFVKRCEEDVCSCKFGEHSGCQCQALTEYSRACASREIMLDWRSQHLCPKQCIQPKVYSECGPACVKTCDADGLQPTCHETCIDGCHCPEGTVQTDNRCLPVNQCPCQHNGITYVTGTTIRVGCNTCKCRGGSWTCSKHRCPGKPHVTY
ncbi:predicted protein [Nematostella vectensis]|uniref:VWFD domain-containing protein n=1 Tax=Nematostella vectensis TaxID=45351 RepID=A7S312_NEMVE|nr:predicted protein [Nematostella vectensis]|eukprot:XP_001633939.1 predicted protein [Nematostella vectensis]